MYYKVKVAPFAGAWIEIQVTESPLSEECGSLPSRERGLKFYIVGLRVLGSPVAPFAGAWIEITVRNGETYYDMVAPFAGAWIEIPLLRLRVLKVASLPSRERGLKFIDSKV